MTANQVTCDTCALSFTPAPWERPDGGGAVVMEFTCPGCERVYPVARITRKGLDLRDDLKRAWRRYHSRVEGHPNPDRLHADVVEPVERAYQDEVTRLG